MGVPNGLRIYRIDVRENVFAIVMYDASVGTTYPSLTEAEREVLAALLAGKTNAEIARERQTSARTVANQVGRLLRKFDVRSRAELVMRVADVEVDTKPSGGIGR